MYLEAEIHTLAKYAEHVYVFACFSKGSNAPRCDYPENVSFYPLQSFGCRLEKAIDIAGSLKYLFAKRLPLMDGYTWGDESAATRVYSKVMYSRALRRYKKMGEAMQHSSIRLGSADLLYSYRLTTTAVLAVWARSHLSNDCGLPRCVSRAHGHDLYDEEAFGGRQAFQGWIVESLDALYPCSLEGSQYLCSRYSEFSSKIEASYLGTRRNPVIKKFEPKEVIKLVSCSNVNRVKRVESIARCVALAQREGFLIEWTHFGDGPLFLRLETFCRRNLKDGSYRLLGKVSNDYVLKQFADNDYDLFINVSSSEGIPQSIMEAISYGLPVVATDVGGSSEAVHIKENGWLLDRNFSDSDFLSALYEYSNLNEDEITYMRRRSREMWDSTFSSDVNSRKFLEAQLEGAGR